MTSLEKKTKLTPMMDLNQTLENLRGIYQAAKFDIEDCHNNPEIQFDFWMENAIQARCDEPNAFVLSTVDGQGQPHGRVVLLKGINQGEFIFYTNYSSSKAQEIEINNKVALTFCWLPLARQVRIEGIVSKVKPEVSDEYFHKRPRGSQLGAIASPQSEKVTSREELEKLFLEAENKFKESEVLPRPDNWGGYGVIPQRYEFWQGRNNRMHDRICYEKAGEGWKVSRLAP
jgi:pyridoxamine 5'-phosphate oxidase